MTETLTPPKSRLGAEPEIGSLDELDAALAEMAWINDETTRVTTAATAKANEIMQAAKAELVCKVGRSSVPFRDRFAALKAAVEAYAQEHRDELLEGTKTHERTQALIKFRNSPRSVAFLEGETEATMFERVLTQITGKKSVRERLRDVLSGIKIFRLTLDQLFDVEIKLSKKDVLNLREKERISDEQLAAIGLEIPEQVENVSIDLKKYHVVS